MSRKILFINFSASLFQSEGELFEQQAAVLLYKTQLAADNEVHYLLNNNLKLAKKINGINFFSRQASSLGFFFHALFFARRNKFDAIIIHGTDFLLEAIFLKKFTSARLIIQHHGEPTYNRKKAKLFGVVNRCVDAYFFNGREVAEEFILKGFSANKVFEVTEGTTDFRLLPVQEKKSHKTIVSVGRLIDSKNTMLLLKAVKILKELRSDFKLHLFYSTSLLEKDLLQYCSENDLQGHVVFRGKGPPAEIEKELNAAAIFLSASLKEGSGYALIEALACGTFPVVSAIPSFEYLLRGLQYKSTFDPHNEKNLALLLDEALNLDTDNSTREMIRRQFDEKASAAAIAGQIEEAVDALLRK